MKRVLRTAGYLAISTATGVLFAGALAGCSSDDTTGGPAADAAVEADSGSQVDSGSTPTPDGSLSDSSAMGDGGVPDTGADTTIQGTVDSGPSVDGGSAVDSGTDGGVVDAGSDTAPEAAIEAAVEAAVDSGLDAGIDAADSAAPTFCQRQAGLAFCADFDEANSLALDGGAQTTFTQIVGTPAEISISSAIALSAPNSLFAALAKGPADTDRSTKVVKMITPANGVAQAIYEFDMNIAQVPLAAGGFATDFQFDDTNGSDTFGFRIGVFSNATGFDHAELQHNHPAIAGGDDITGPIPISAGTWQHVKMVVAYSGSVNDSGNQVAFQLYLNNVSTPAVNATYPAIFAKAPFARFATGMVFAFDPNNKDWGIYYDNITLKLQ